MLDVLVETGQQVSEGEVLGTLEAMKMELSLKAPFAGTVTMVGAAAGEQVALDLEIERGARAPEVEAVVRVQRHRAVMM